MCQVHGEDDIILDSLVPSISSGAGRKCVKCNENVAIIMIGTNGTFCELCFEKHFTHKFRASMGRNPVVRNGEKVAIAFSGGSNSAALINLVKEGLSNNAARKLKFKAGIIFVDESSIYPHIDGMNNKLEEVRDLMIDSGFPYHVIKLEEVLNVDDINIEITSGMATTSKSMMIHEIIHSSLTLTAKQELLYRLRCRLLSYKATQLGYNHVFLGETSTRLAVNILSNVALGRGFHLAQDTGFTDGERHQKIGCDLLRPLRDVTTKEVVMYNTLHKVKTVFFPNMATKQSNMSSIQNLTESFVFGLVAGFPSTETTVYRTSNKIKGVKFVEGNAKTISTTKFCSLCLGVMDTHSSNSKASAKADLYYSETLCKGLLGSSVESSVDGGKNSSTELRSKTEGSLCYSCLATQKETQSSAKDYLAKLAIKSVQDGDEKEICEKLNDVL
ncbi:unnamed protein product [Clavelina lepadiformis]|uniref:Cytoplasmic tRNA 2-thiolation protein 2 n=1 Tax=Clavelina lepadiformis TaxID=159417 RepID=A0ABP0GLQ9_CLALP